MIKKMINSGIKGLTGRSLVRFLCNNCLGVTNELNNFETKKSSRNCDTEKNNIFALDRDLKNKGVVYC